MKRCDICIEENCRKDGREPGSCDCANCSVADKCNKVLMPTIRITKKCTQDCRHCCFECSPANTEMMSIDTARNVALFLKRYEVKHINVMGGEFFCNDNWYDIVAMFVDATTTTRLVSNGDFNEVVARKLGTLNDKLYVCLSRDRWHTNANIDRAFALCEKYDVHCRIATEEQTGTNTIVPVGNASLGFDNMFSFLQTYCSNPEHKYSFLIDETGDVFKCPFGIWRFTNVVKHIAEGDSSFYARFKEVFQKFNNAFISSCARCYRAHEHNF